MNSSMTGWPSESSRERVSVDAKNKQLYIISVCCEKIRCPDILSMFTVIREWFAPLASTVLPAVCPQNDQFMATPIVPAVSVTSNEWASGTKTACNA